MTRPTGSNQRSQAPLGNPSSGVAASRDHIPKPHREETMITNYRPSRTEMAVTELRRFERSLRDQEHFDDADNVEAVLSRFHMNHFTTVRQYVETRLPSTLADDLIHECPVFARLIGLVTRPPLKLLGTDGNAFAILARAQRAATKAGWTVEQWAQFKAEATRGDYDNLLGVVQEYFDVN